MHQGLAVGGIEASKAIRRTEKANLVLLVCCSAIVCSDNSLVRRITSTDCSDRTGCEAFN